MRAARSYIVFFIGCCFLLEGCIMFRPSASKLYRHSLDESPCYDMIIVPGAPVNSPYYDKIVRIRVAWAVDLYKRGITDRIMMSGSAVSTPYKESIVMKEYAVSMGVPEKDVFTEEKAQHTTENLWYGYQEAKELGCSRVAVATDPFQTRFIYGFSRRKLPEINFLPVMSETMKMISDTLPRIDIEQYRIHDFTPLHEYQNRWQRLRGTLGHYIDYKNSEYCKSH